MHAIDVWHFLAGLGLFLFGLAQLEQGLKSLVGRSFKKLLQKYTQNTFLGILIGVVVTAILQSSSVVNLLLLALVGAGVMQFRHALGVVLGSNLGTTFTGWLVALLGFRADIGSFALPLIALGTLGLVYSGVSRVSQNYFRTLMGLGLLFFGLGYMKQSMSSLSTVVDMAQIQQWGPLAFWFVGFGLTAVMNSSSAMMAMTLSALNSGLIGLSDAAAVMIGADIGTTITVLVGSIGVVAVKKRVALTHLLFNVFSGTIAFLVIWPWLPTIKELLNIEDHLLMLVIFHSAFNLAGIVLFLPFLPFFARFLETKFLSASDSFTTLLSRRSLQMPSAALEAIGVELKNLLYRVALYFLRGLHLPGSEKEKLKYVHNGNEDAAFLALTRDSQYERVKILAGEIFEFTLLLQQQQLHESESHRLVHLQNSVRNVMEAAKSLKDILHNVEELKGSANDFSFEYFSYCQSVSSQLMQQIFELHSRTDQSFIFESLSEILKQNKERYDQKNREISARFSQLSELELTTLLNVNRELHHAHRCFLLAHKDFLLSPENASVFDSLPYEG